MQILKQTLLFQSHRLKNIKWHELSRSSPFLLLKPQILALSFPCFSLSFISQICFACFLTLFKWINCAIFCSASFVRFMCIAMKTYEKVSVSQSCLTLCDPKDCSPPGSSTHGILQARILEWVAISFSRGSS